jgi:Ca2+:H+ antiporter
VDKSTYTPIKLNIVKPSLNWLLIFLPVAGFLHFTTGSATLIFFASCLGLIPLAGWMGEATEHLADKSSEGIGGLLNATFGNAAELIIALTALHAGLNDLVKASIAGSIIGNLLLVQGAAAFAGGMKYKTLNFNASGVGSYVSMLFLAGAALVLQAVFHDTVGGGNDQAQYALSAAVSVVLVLTYVCSLLFSLITHRQLFTGEAAEVARVTSRHTRPATSVIASDLIAAKPAGDDHVSWSVTKSLLVLAGATVLVAIASEWLVDSVQAAARAMGMGEIFIGVIVVAIVGNAAEHGSAVMVARNNRMDLALGVAIGSSIQVALFVAPVLVFASFWIGPQPLDLVFDSAELAALVIAVLVTEQVVKDGETNWLEGVQLLSVYAVIAMMFYFLPVVPAAAAH